MKHHKQTDLEGLMDFREDVASDQAMKDAHNLLKLVTAGEEDVREGRVVSQEEIFQKLEKYLESIQYSVLDSRQGSE